MSVLATLSFPFAQDQLRALALRASGHLHWPPNFSGMPGAVVLLPLAFGVGAYLFLTAQPLGQPKPDVTEQLRRLDVDERMRRRFEQHDDQALFASPLLERMLRPVVEDAGRWLGHFMSAFGLARGADVERKLALARAGVTPVQYFGEKALSGLLGAALWPAADWIGFQPFGPWPAWLWVAGFVVGFLAPDWELNRRLAARRTACLMELPTLIDMVALALAAGMAAEPALDAVARRSRGAIGHELQLASRQAALGESSLVAALAEMADRNDIPELTTFVSQLRASQEQGLPLVQALAAQADALREQKRVRIVEEGGKSSIKMAVPIALFVLPTLFVILLVPAGLQIMRLSGG